MVQFDNLLETFERYRPEVRENDAHGVEGLGTKGVEVAGSFVTLMNQTGKLEDLQVVADRLLTDIEVGRDLAGREFVAAHESKHKPPLGIGERPKDSIGAS